MSRQTIQISLLLLAAALAIGCKRTRTPDAIAVAIETDPQASSSGPKTVVARGSIRGKATFAGNAPTPRPINNQACHGNHPKPIVEESIVVNPNGTLKNVVVYLKEVPGDSAISSDTPIIDQVDCHYIPHVTAVAAGQKVIFKSSDATLHNVNMQGNGANTGNFAMPGPGMASPRKVADVEFTKVKCDVHPWMFCWIAVLDGPYFAVTDDKGEFEIKNVPAGTYTLNAWHELFPPQTTPVAVVADKAAEATLAYKAP